MQKLYGDQSLLLPKDIIISLKYGITELSDEELLKRYERVKPLLELKDGNKYVLENKGIYDLRNEAYIWGAKGIEEQIISECKPLNKAELQELRDFICLHRFSFPGFFKPSIAEVLSQFPSDLLDSANYFEIIESPENVNDLDMYNYATIKSYHLSRVMAYRLK